MPEGTVVTTRNGIDYIITYVGGDGNDVSLTALALPESNTFSTTFIASTTSEGGVRSGSSSSMSSDGRYIAFHGITSTQLQVFVKDRQTGLTTLEPVS